MSDVYETITSRVVAMLETVDVSNYRAPWHSAAAKSPAVNFMTGAEYNGVNRFILGMAQRTIGFESAEWGTYKQWQERGAQVRKGERGCPVVKYGTYSKGEDEDGDEITRGFLKGYTVFNADQVDGFAGEKAVPAYPLNPDERLSAAEVFFGNLGADVREGGSKAYYQPAQDFIAMPDYGRFVSAEAFYATLAHEHTHWTGHGLRLDRLQSCKFGDRDYAFEELIAELGAAFLCDHLGLSNEPREDHAIYLKSWLRALDDDKRFIFRAATAAQKAVDFMKAKQYSPSKSAPERIPAKPIPAAMQAAAQLSLF